MTDRGHPLNTHTHLTPSSKDISSMKNIIENVYFQAENIEYA